MNEPEDGSGVTLPPLQQLSVDPAVTWRHAHSRPCFLQRLLQMNPRLSGNNVLIVEDETLLALMLEDLLLDSGHSVVHASSLPDAMAALEREQFDAAILDINLNGTEVFPVAARLRELRTPFVFASASDADRIGPEYQQEQLIPKPYTIGQLQQSLSHMLSSPRA